MTDIHEPSYQAGVEAERHRIRLIFENDLSATLPHDAIRLALESDLDPVIADFRLRAEAAKPLAERKGAEILPHDRSDYTPHNKDAAYTMVASATLSPQQVMDAVNAETKAGSNLADTSKSPVQAGAVSIDAVMARVNAEAKHSGF